MPIAGGEMSGWIVRCTRLWLLACLGILAPLASSEGKQETRSIEVSALNPHYGLLEKSESVQRKTIEIEETYRYVEHVVTIISAHPRDGGDEEWTHSDGVIQGPDGRIQAVWVEVKARNKGLFGEAVRVRARLSVTLEEVAPPPPSPTSTLPSPAESPDKTPPE
jgi:hypothetical protein